MAGLHMSCCTFIFQVEDDKHCGEEGKRARKEGREEGTERDSEEGEREGETLHPRSLSGG